MNSGTINNVFNGPQRLVFSETTAEQLAQQLPKGKPIVLRGIGSVSDQAVTDQFGSYLGSHGFRIVTRDTIGMAVPAPERKILIQTGDALTILQIAPSAGQ
ncbi:hypothetical protein [Bradyrhizobium sp. AZCC 2230]|uniref:hypothetical protein n=1 Tax=Bradyrhizobium sp. AZCC 2230 TaxID=3117021 RepID=UPI003FA5FDAC